MPRRYDREELYQLRAEGQIPEGFLAADSQQQLRSELLVPARPAQSANHAAAPAASAAPAPAPAPALQPAAAAEGPAPGSPPAFAASATTFAAAAGLNEDEAERVKRRARRAAQQGPVAHPPPKQVHKDPVEPRPRQQPMPSRGHPAPRAQERRPQPAKMEIPRGMPIGPAFMHMHEQPAAPPAQRQPRQVLSAAELEATLANEARAVATGLQSAYGPAPRRPEDQAAPSLPQHSALGQPQPLAPAAQPVPQVLPTRARSQADLERELLAQAGARPPAPMPQHQSVPLGMGRGRPAAPVREGPIDASELERMLCNPSPARPPGVQWGPTSGSM
eukprot:TRINITY_DN14574_c0_g1_i1.p1 TRINITY_DN14574_c0_g1~~TRINITY_DN14574_c0_g1_i1.p1  ORF type:complete len:369 (+),score=69.78 TRINITY_DN14574_c0_g1_i1:110-1108(+)